MMMEAITKPRRLIKHLNRPKKMRTLRYLTFDVITHTLAASLVLFLVVFRGRFIKYLAEAAIGDLSASILLPVMLYKLPAFFELILPLGFYLGLLLSFGRLYADSEMVIFRASGTSQVQLFQQVAPATLLITVGVAIIALFAGPYGGLKANALLSEPRSAEGMHVLAEGRFKKQRGGDYVTYVERIDDDGRMDTVFVAERQRSESGISLSATLASAGAIEIDQASGRRYLALSNGKRYDMAPGSAELTEAQFSGYRSLIPEVEGGLRSQARIETLPTATLISSDNPEHLAILGWRVSLPLIGPIMALFAIPLSRTDSRRGRYARLGPALLVFLFSFVALSQARTISQESGSALVFFVVHGIFLVSGMFLLFREDLPGWFRART